MLTLKVQKIKEMHCIYFYFSVMRPDPQYILKVTQLLVEAGVNINAKDKYGAIPLNYAITVVKLPTETL